MFLREFVLHAGDGCAEEEGDEVLVGAISADLLEGGNVGGTVFKADDEQDAAKYEPLLVSSETVDAAVAVLTIRDGILIAA